MNQELPDAQARFRKKAEEPEIKWPTSVGSSKKKGDSRKASAAAAAAVKLLQLCPTL